MRVLAISASVLARLCMSVPTSFFLIFKVGGLWRNTIRELGSLKMHSCNLTSSRGLGSLKLHHEPPPYVLIISSRGSGSFKVHHEPPPYILISSRGLGLLKNSPRTPTLCYFQQGRWDLSKFTMKPHLYSYSSRGGIVETSPWTPTLCSYFQQGVGIVETSPWTPTLCEWGWDLWKKPSI